MIPTVSSSRIAKGTTGEQPRVRVTEDYTVITETALLARTNF